MYAAFVAQIDAALAEPDTQCMRLEWLTGSEHWES